MKHSLLLLVLFTLILGGSICPPQQLQAQCNVTAVVTTGITGYSYANIQWQASSNAFGYMVRLKQVGLSTWNEVEVTTNEAVLYVAPCSQYEVQVKTLCGVNGESSFTGSTIINTQGCGDTYCYAYSSNTDYEWINSVSINTINNTSGANWGYGNYTNLSTSLEQGQSYLLTLNPGFAESSFAEHWRVWIDFNQDDSFNNTSELVYDSGFATLGQVQSFINIPATAFTGNTRMRVAMKWIDTGDIAPSACGAINYGEVEDYTINITSGTFECTGPFISLNSNPTACGGNTGQISSTISGGTPPYNYQWSNGSGTSTILALGAGTYTVTITDANNCSNTAQAAISSIGGVQIEEIMVNDATCGQGNGSIFLEVAGTGLSFDWAHNSLLISPITVGLNAGVYTVTITDSGGCSTVENFTVGNADNMEMNLVNVNDASCGQANGSAQVSVAINGSVSYEWAHAPGLNAATATGLQAGLYSVTATDANGCTATQTISIIDTGAPTINGLSAQDATCGQATGSITVNASGGTLPLSYSWSHNIGLNNNTATDLQAGSYSVTITDATNCSAITATSINNVGPTISNTVVNPAACNEANGSITLNVAAAGGGAIGFSWSHNATLGGAIANNLAAGLYTVTITDFTANCSIVETISVSGSQAMMGSLSTSIAICGSSSGSANISVMGGTMPYNYEWSNGQATPTATELTAGTYTVTVSDANDCVLIETAIITSVNPLGLEIVSGNATCEAANAEAIAFASNGTAPYQFNWSNGATELSLDDLAAGVYSLTVTDANGCTAIATTTINTEGSLSANIQNVTPVSCGEDNGSAQVVVTEGTPPYNYQWDFTGGTNSATINNMPAGFYTVTVSDVNGCSTALSVVVEELGGTVIFLEDTSNSCEENDGTATVTVFTAATPFAVLWNNGQTTTTATGLASGTYTVTVTDVNGCETWDAVLVQNLQQPIANLAADSLIYNGSDIIVLDAFHPDNDDANYAWSTGENTAVIGVEAAGTYTVTVTSVDGCTATDEVVVLLNTSITATTAIQANIYPNPSQNKVWIQHPNTHPLQAELLSIDGQVLLKTTLIPSISNALDLSSYPSGLYLLVLKNKTTQQVYRIVKK